MNLASNPTSNPSPGGDQAAATLTPPERRSDLTSLLAASSAPLPANLRSETRAVASRLFGVGDQDWGPLNPGDSLGPYRIEELLGSGGQGHVYAARHQQLGRTMALKVPRRDVADRLFHEARVAARVEHPRIVRVEDIREDGDTPYLVMEHCTGGSLEELLEQHPKGLPLKQVLAISRAVLEALAHAHGRGVVHRDVKPSNVLFDDKGGAKLADLGIGTLATAGEELTHSIAMSADPGAAIAGTPLYMAPEQENPARLQGGKVDGRADLFSFGKLLFAMVTGASPATIRPPSRLRSGLTAGWDDLIFALVEEDRTRRPANSGEVLKRLVALSQPTTMSLPSPGELLKQAGLKEPLKELGSAAREIGEVTLDVGSVFMKVLVMMVAVVVFTALGGAITAGVGLGAYIVTGVPAPINFIVGFCVALVVQILLIVKTYSALFGKRSKRLKPLAPKAAASPPADERSAPAESTDLPPPGSPVEAPATPPEQS